VIFAAAKLKYCGAGDHLGEKRGYFLEIYWKMPGLQAPSKIVTGLRGFLFHGTFNFNSGPFPTSHDNSGSP
jgi:hypothetical protein